MAMRRIWIAILSLAAAASANAQDAGAQDAGILKPDGWRASGLRNTYSGLDFHGPDGVSFANVNHFSANNDLEGLARTAVNSADPPGGSTLVEREPAPFADSGALLGGGIYEVDGVRLNGVGLAIPHRHGGVMTCSITYPFSSSVPDHVRKFTEGCIAAARRGDFVYPDDAAKQQKRTQIQGKSPMTATASIEAVLLAEFWISGVGGAIYPDYRPVVLFADGIAIRDFTAPADGIDRAAFARENPDDVARWSKQGKDYMLEFPGDREPKRIPAGRERPATFAPGARLDATFRRLSGGGNTGQGGDMMVTASRGYTFSADGRFTASRTASSSGSGVFTGASGATSGRYVFSSGALTLTYDDGHVERLSAYRSTVNAGVAWFGGRSFTN